MNIPADILGDSGHIQLEPIFDFVMLIMFLQLFL